MSALAAPVPVVILGAGGRMGLSLLRELARCPQLRLQAAVTGQDSPHLGRDAGELAGLAPMGLSVRADLESALAGAALALDFSTALAAPRHIAHCAAAGVPLLLGTTGLGPDLPAVIARASERIPLLVASNTSLGAAVLQDLVRRAAAALGTGFDVHVQDIHHGQKKDAPSGTALALGQAAVEGRGGPDRLDYSSIRGGDVVGEHAVQFLGQGERLALAHVATDRAIFARGALQAGLWLVRQKPGTHHMADIFKEK